MVEIINERILKKIKELSKDNNEYLILGGGYVPSKCKIIFKRVKLKEPILSAIYGVCSGGDPGSFYAVSKNYVYDWAYEKVLKRNKAFEEKYNLSLNDTSKLVNYYITLADNGNTSFGYDNLSHIDISYRKDLDVSLI